MSQLRDGLARRFHTNSAKSRKNARKADRRGVSNGSQKNERSISPMVANTAPVSELEVRYGGNEKTRQRGCRLTGREMP